MSLLFFTPGPALRVSLHATGHIAMVLLFPGRGA
jgi:hypothetical protein